MQKQISMAAVLGVFALTMSQGSRAEDESCASATTKAQLLRMVIKHMKADQMLNDMSDLDSAHLSLSNVETARNANGSISCKALLTLRVLYGAGLVRAIDNDVTYDLSKRGEDQHVAVTIHKFATAFRRGVPTISPHMWLRSHTPCQEMGRNLTKEPLNSVALETPRVKSL